MITVGSRFIQSSLFEFCSEMGFDVILSPKALVLSYWPNTTHRDKTTYNKSWPLDTVQ